MSGMLPKGMVYWKNTLKRKVQGKSYIKDSYSGYSVYRGWDWEKGIIEVCNNVRPDIVMLESGGALKLVPALKKMKTPIVYRLHDTALDNLGGNPNEFSGIQYVSVSQFLSDRFEQKFGFGTSVVPPIVLRERCAVVSNRRKVVFVNPRPVKGGSIVLELARRRPDIPFKIFEAWEKDNNVVELENIAKTLPNVEWVSSTQDPRNIYADAHTILVPSQADETWGRVVTEAQINGIPVIASNRGALPESVGSGGILIDPPDDIQAWEKALGNLWDDSNVYQHYVGLARQGAERSEIGESILTDRLLKVLEEARSASYAP